MMNSDAPLPYGSTVVVTNASLKTYGKVFTVISKFVADNRYGWNVKVAGNGLSFVINKSNIALVSAPVKEPAIFIPELVVEQPEIEPVPLEYRVASSSNNMLKDVFYTIEAADEAIKAWAKRTNQELTFQILTVVKSYKITREVILEEV